MLGGDEVTPGLGGVGGEREAGTAEVGDGGCVVGSGGEVEIAEAAPEICFPRGVEGDGVVFAGAGVFSIAFAVVGGGADGGEAGGAADDGALFGGAEAVGGGFEALVVGEGFVDEFRHTGVTEFAEPAGADFIVLAGACGGEGFGGGEGGGCDGLGVPERGAGGEEGR